MYAVLLVALLSLLPRHRGQPPPVVDKENAANAREQQSQSEPQPEQPSSAMDIVKDLVPVLSPIATLAVSAGVAYVAWKQWRVARNRFRLDLFDRRYKVYEAAREFLRAIQSEPQFQHQQLFAFDAGTADALFFFKADVVSYLKQLRSRALDLRELIRSGAAVPSGSQAVPHVDQEKNELLWFIEQNATITNKFTSYLGLCT